MVKIHNACIRGAKSKSQGIQTQGPLGGLKGYLRPTSYIRAEKPDYRRLNSYKLLSVVVLVLVLSLTLWGLFIIS